MFYILWTKIVIISFCKILVYDNLNAKLKHRANMEEEYTSELESMKKLLNKQNQDSWYRREADLLEKMDSLKKRVGLFG